MVTAYNHERFIRQCLDSIESQTILPKRLIILDDFSKDRTVSVIEKWMESSNLSVIFNKAESNQGVCARLNYALEALDTEFFIHISGDDWMEPNRIEIQLQGMNTSTIYPSVGISSLREVDIDGELIVEHDYSFRLRYLSDPIENIELLDVLLKENIITAPSVILRTSSIKSIGGYDEKLAFEDYDLWLRLAVNHKFIFIPGIVTNYRVFAKSLSRDPSQKTNQQTSEALMLMKHYGRKITSNELIQKRVTSIIKDLLRLKAYKSAIKLRCRLNALIHNSAWVEK